MNKLSAIRLGFAFGITFGLFYIACIAMMTLFGEQATVFVFNSLMHGIDTTEIIRMNVPISDSLIGLTGTFGLGWVMGALIALFYNFFPTKKP